MNIIKKIFLLGASALLLTGCSLTKDSLEDATIYTTVYPIEYLTEFLYSDYAEIDSIYPNEADVASYELTEKQLKEYARGDLFIYNGLGNEKNIAKDMINVNGNLLIIDVANGLNYTYGIEELWMSPNNYLMLAKNIKDYLIEYLESTTIIDYVENKYDEVLELLKKYKNIETHQQDIENGKMVITIEAENNKDIEDIEQDFGEKDFIIDLAHFAFHFGEEVEKVLAGGEVPDFDITKPFTRKRLQ